MDAGRVGILMAGSWNTSQSYEMLSCVSHNGKSWGAKKDVPAGIEPSEANSAFWQLMSDRGVQGIQGPVGPQGNSAFDGTGVEIVNNLTQGGQTAALSAEQGKVLKTELTELESEVDATAEQLTELKSKIDGEDSTQTLYATCNAANNSKSYTKILSNVTSIGACKMVTAGDVVYTGKGNNTCFGIYAIEAGATGLSSIANISDLVNGGITGQIYPSGTEVLSYAGNDNLGGAKDIYVGSRFSGTVGVIFEGERIEGLTDKVNANTASIVQSNNRISAVESRISLVSEELKSIDTEIEELQGILVGGEEDDGLTTIFADGFGTSSKKWTLLLSNVTKTPPIVVTAETEIVYTGTSNSTFLSLDSVLTGNQATSNTIIAPISGTPGQIIEAGTILFNVEDGFEFTEPRDVYIGVRYSGTLKIEIGEKKESLGLSEQVKKNTADIVSNSSRISALENGAISSIIDLYKQQIQQARQLGYRSTRSESLYPIKPLAFIHISDTHTSKPNTRAIQILNYLGANGFVKFLMHTGDILEDPKNNPPAWSNIVSAAQYPVLLTSGNHDVGNWATSPSQYKTDAQFYNAFVAPQINAWGLKSDGGGTPHPSGKNYYFTDFTDEKIRLIVAYEYEIPSVESQQDAGRGARWISQEQTDWFINSLLTTPNGYGVIVAKHAPDGLIGHDKNPFNSPFKDGENTQQTFQYRDGVAYTAFFADIVQAFIDRTSINYVVSQSAASYQGTINVIADFRSMPSNVEFICHVSGHVHADNITHLATHPKQLELNINCDNTIANNQRSETLLIEGTTFEDAINVYGIDRNQGLIHVLRIGANYSGNGDRKDMLTISYK